MARDEKKEKRLEKEGKKTEAAKPDAKAAKPEPAKAGKLGKAPAAEVAPEVKEEKKKKEKKSQKERPHSKKKHTKVQIWKKYKLEGNKLARKGENCPRCGAGTFLAVYKNRKYCGKCGWGQVAQ